MAGEREHETEAAPPAPPAAAAAIAAVAPIGNRATGALLARRPGRGVAHPRLLRREHCRIVQANGASAALNMLYPYPKPNADARLAKIAARVAQAVSAD